MRFDGGFFLGAEIAQTVTVKTFLNNLTASHETIDYLRIVANRKDFFFLIDLELEKRVYTSDSHYR